MPDTVSVLNMLRLQPAKDIANLNSIIPAATIALGLMYLKTNDVEAAAAFTIGETVKLVATERSAMLMRFSLYLQAPMMKFVLLGT